jgi:hypothetical protein
MLRALIIGSLMAAMAVGAYAQARTPVPKDMMVRVQMPRSQLTDIINFYRVLTARKTWIDAELRFDERIDLFYEHELRRDEAIAFIRETLRKKGIEIRETGDSEAYVSRVAL